MDISPSTRPTEAITNAQKLIAARQRMKTPEALFEWQHLAESEITSLDRFIAEGNERLGQASAALWATSTDEEGERRKAEYNHIEQLLVRLKQTRADLGLAQSWQSAQSVPVSKPRSTPVIWIVGVGLGALTCLFVAVLIAIIVSRGMTTGTSVSSSYAQTNQLQAVDMQATTNSITFAEIREKNKALTGVQWRQYTEQIQGRVANNWSGWIDEVSDSGGYHVMVDMDPPDTSLSVYDVRFPTNQQVALSLSKGQRISFSGHIERVSDLLGARIDMVDVDILSSTMGANTTDSPEQSYSSTQGTYRGEATPDEICNNLHNMTSSQWTDYFMQLKGKRVDQWTGWVIDVQNNFTNMDTIIVDLSGTNSLLSTTQAMIRIPHEQATKLNKQDRIEIAGTLQSVIDISGVCAISFNESKLIPQ